MAAAVAVAVALGACGGGSSTSRSPCPRAIQAAVGAHASAALVDRSPGVVTCAYRAGAPRPAEVRVTVDTAPQASFRFGRTVVERSQAHLGGDRGELPVQLAGIGEGAAWTPAPRELLATDGRRLVTVTVALPRTAAAARATAARVARAALG